MRDSISCSRILANAIGINESMIYNHIEYYVGIENQDNPKCHKDGRVWTYGDYEHLQEKYFTWLSVDALKDVVKKLRAMGLITVEKYASDGYSRRNWYSHNPEITEKFIKFWQENGSIPCSKREHNSVIDLWINIENGKMPRSENGKMPRYNTIELNTEKEKILNGVEQVYSPISVKVKPSEKPTPTPKKKAELSKFESWLISEFEGVFGGKIKMPESVRKLLVTKRLHNDINYLSPVEYFEHPRYGDIFRQYVQYKMRVFKNLVDAQNVSFSVGLFIRNHIILYWSKQWFINYAEKQGYKIVNAVGAETSVKPDISVLYVQLGNYMLNEAQIKNNAPEFYEFYQSYDDDWDLFLSKWSDHANL